MKDHMFLVSVKLVSDDFNKFFSTLFEFEPDEKIWENSVKLGNEIGNLIDLLTYENVDRPVTIDSTINKINENLELLAKNLNSDNYADLIRLTINPLYALSMTNEEMDLAFISQLSSQLNEIKKKFVRAVKNHKEYYKKK